MGFRTEEVPGQAAVPTTGTTAIVTMEIMGTTVTVPLPTSDMVATTITPGVHTWIIIQDISMSMVITCTTIQDIITCTANDEPVTSNPTEISRPGCFHFRSSLSGIA